MKLTRIFMFAATLTAPLAMAQMDPAPETTTTTTTTEPAHVWNNPSGWWENHTVFCPSMPNKYTCNELSLDLFGTYVARQTSFTHLFQTSIRDGTWGGGVGLNYFITRELGIGGDINMPHDGGNLVNNVNGSLIARLPIESSGLAPYIFGGGGRTTDRVWDWTGHAGVGLEFRWNPVAGVFVDSRYVWGNHTSDNALFRAGFRMVF